MSYEGATPEQLRHPLVHELLMVHEHFRREMALMLRFANDLINGQTELSSSETTTRVQALIQVGIQYTHHLHMHHTLESSYLFPALEKQDPSVAPIVARLQHEHDEIAVLIDEFSNAIRDFAQVNPEVVNTDLRRLAEALQAHLAYEETHVCPLLTRFSRWPF